SNRTGPVKGYLTVATVGLEVDGPFQFEIPAGMYPVHIFSEGHSRRYQDVFFDGTPVNIVVDHFKDQMIRISGHITTEQGWPLSAVALRFTFTGGWQNQWLLPPDHPLLPIQTVQSNQTGFYELMAAPGTHSITIWRGGFETVNLDGWARSDQVVNYTLGPPMKPEPKPVSAVEPVPEMQEAPALVVPIVILVIWAGLLRRR
ncbi:MAG: hypothetical protein ACPHK8_02050, partial [Thermoplasmatota archaeon]